MGQPMTRTPREPRRHWGRNAGALGAVLVASLCLVGLTAGSAGAATPEATLGAATPRATAGAATPGATPGRATPGAAPGAGVTFGAPSAADQWDVALTFQTALQTATAPVRVSLLSHLPTDTVLQVQDAHLTQNAGGLAATVRVPGHVTPNTTIEYRFRAEMPDGTSVLGPEASYTVADTRFSWQTLQGSLVRLHWYDGGQDFAQEAITFGEDAISGTEQLLGVQETQPVDFFIYASKQPFLDALGPSTSENVGGEAIASIRTLFALIGPTDIGSSWVPDVITHELTHLVFNTAVDNPYHFPPRWLNEGLAVYRAQGYESSDRGLLAAAVSRGTVIPLDGLAGQFPAGAANFSLAYAESVSAIDYFIRTYGQDDLVKLIRSYSAGVTDDEAFTAAIGEGVGAFADAWLRAQGATAPATSGPQPAPTGPVPPGWTTGPVATTAPTVSAAPPTAGSSTGPSASSVPPTAAPIASPVPAGTASPQGGVRPARFAASSGGRRASAAAAAADATAAPSATPLPSASPAASGTSGGAGDTSDPSHWVPMALVAVLAFGGYYLLILRRRPRRSAGPRGRS